MIRGASCVHASTRPGGGTLSDTIFCSGVGLDGDYLLPPRSPMELAAIALDRPLSTAETEERSQRAARDEPTFAVRTGVNATDLAEAGWAVVFPTDCDPAVVDALRRLLSHRRSQAGSRYRLLSGADGYRPGERKRAFLRRCGAAPTGAADPDRMPYYILLVGSPDEIPYDFQYELGVQYAVGRLDLPSPQAYRNYAASITDYERRSPARLRRLAAFAPAYADDSPTQVMAGEVVAPVAERAAASGLADEVELVPPGASDHKRLTDLYGGGAKPAMLLAAGHGLGVPSAHPQQRDHQGALLTADWPGPGHPVASDHLFGAGDVHPEADLGGLVTFNIACFVAGTPKLDSYASEGPKMLAPEPFTSALPRRLLGHPGGAALAMIGHIDRAWTGSYRWPGTDDLEIARVEDVVTRVLAGDPVGLAVEPVNEQAAELSVELGELRKADEAEEVVDAAEVAAVFTAMHDARNLVVLGDPAARLAPTIKDPAP